MNVSELGEFGLIALIKETVSSSKNPEHSSWQRLVLDSGDDAAAWHGDSSIQLGTTDTMVEGIHFIPGTFQWEELGWKSLAANLSDIAAMGGTPLYALVSLSLAGDTKVDSIIALCRGMLDLASRHGVALIGGNITSSPLMVITITLLGNMEGGRDMLSRSAARPGDQIAVTGHLGTSAAAMNMLRTGLNINPEATSLLRQAHFRPQPRIAEGKTLLACGVRAAMDISDGLISDLTHICQKSGVGARIIADRLPIHSLVDATFENDAQRLALGGGEDFELLFTAPNRVMDQAKTALSVPTTIIGDIVSQHPGTVAILDSHGAELNSKGNGWDHFQK